MICHNAMASSRVSSRANACAAHMATPSTMRMHASVTTYPGSMHSHVGALRKEARGSFAYAEFVRAVSVPCTALWRAAH